MDDACYDQMHVVADDVIFNKRGLSEDDRIRAVFSLYLDHGPEPIDQMTLHMTSCSLEKMPISVMLAPLAATVLRKNEMQFRRDYFNRVAGELVRRDEARILELLKGLF